AASLKMAHACDDGDPCTSGGHCDSTQANACASGTYVCLPATPGPITGPSSSDSGAYTISWGFPPGSVWVDHYDLYENNLGILTIPYSTPSAGISGRVAGTYSYTVRSCNSAGCSAFTAPFSVTVNLPGVPGSLSGSTGTNNTTGSYSISWTVPSGVVTSYQWTENSGAAQTTTSTSVAFSGKADGTYTYKARARGPTGGGR